MLITLRFVASIGGRMIFPFIPAIREGTGLSKEQMGQVIFARDMTGLLATVVGNRTDRYGRGRFIFGGSAALGIGLLLSSLGATGILIGLIIYGVGRLALNIAMNAWVADEVAYERRGRAVGLIELTWASAAMIGIPVCGVLIDQLGWRAPFILFGGLSIGLALLAQRKQLDETKTQRPATPTGDARTSAPIASWLNANSAATLLGPAMLAAGAQFMFFGHGSWLEEAYGFDPKRIGFAVMTLGAAEFFGSWCSSRLTDRLGKRNAVAAGGLVMALAMVGLIVLSTPALAVGIGLLIVLFFGFEFAIVSSLSLIAELRPESRAQIIGWSVGISTVLKAVVALAAGWIDERYAFRALVFAALACTVVSVALMAIAQEPKTAPAAA